MRDRVIEVGIETSGPDLLEFQGIDELTVDFGTQATLVLCAVQSSVGQVGEEQGDVPESHIVHGSRMPVQRPGTSP